MGRRRSEGPPADLVAFTADQYGRVLGSLVLFTGDRRLAEELAQEAFVRVCQHWEKVRTMDAPGAWTHRVAMNLAISAARKRRNGRAAEERLRTTTASTADETATDEVRAAVLALPADERAVVVLRYYADLDVASTAAALSIPEGTVKTRCRRALASLRDGGIESAKEEVAP